MPLFNGHELECSVLRLNMAHSLACVGWADVVVIGSGLAGLSAAVAAEELGRSVIVLEKAHRIGGNSAKASSGINIALNDDDIDAFVADTLRSGKGLSDDRLVRKLCAESAASVAWLGVELTERARLGGHSAARTLRNATGPNVGSVLVQAMASRLKSAKVITEARVEHIETRDNYGFRVRYASSSLEAGAVVLATGGFGAATNLPYPTTNGPTATGDGLQLGVDLGGSLMHMDQIQIHPTGFVNPDQPNAPSKILAPEALRGAGGILVDHCGRRFVNELDTRDAVVDKMPAEAFLVVPRQTPGIDFYVRSKLLQPYTQVDFDSLDDTLREYNAAAGGKKPDPFGKSYFPNAPPFDPLYIGRVVPCVHYCMGGLKVDEHAAILNQDKACPIPGLFAAGECTGGLHGANRLAGNSLLDCLVFGKQAGINAAFHVAQLSQKSTSVNTTSYSLRSLFLPLAPSFLKI